MDERSMSFVEHLAELRTRLVRSVIGVTVAFTVAWIFHQEIFDLLARPVLAGLRVHGIYGLQALQVTETITVHLEVALVAAVVLAMPFLFQQVWGFIAPGLFAHERRLVMPVVLLISGFFLLGVVFCYFVFLPMVVDYLVGFTVDMGGVTLIPTVERTFALVVTFLLVFGLVFELPLLMFFLALLGVVDVRKYWAFGRYFIVVAFIIGAIFTPPDPLSQLLMAVPMCVLYYVGVAFAWVARAARKGGSEAVTRWVVGGVFVLFASAVGLASWLWTTSGQGPRLATGVPAGTHWVLRAAPAAALGRGLLAEAGAPGPAVVSPLPDVVVLAGGASEAWSASGKDWDCDAGTKLGGSCVLAGPVDGPREDGKAFAGLDADTSPVRLIVDEACTGALVPAGLGDGLTLGIQATAPPGGPAQVTLRLAGPEPARLAAARWAREVRVATTPWRAAPGVEGSALGRALAWTQGDFQVDEAGDVVELSASVSEPRAIRLLGGLVRDLRERCEGTP
jgi:sec-independent protein translocase protein TatC